MLYLDALLLHYFNANFSTLNLHCLMLFPETKRVSESSLTDYKHNHINPGSWVQSLPTQFSHSELSSSPSSSTELVIDRNQTARFYIGDNEAQLTPTTVSFLERRKLLKVDYHKR